MLQPFDVTVVPQLWSVWRVGGDADHRQHRADADLGREHAPVPHGDHRRGADQDARADRERRVQRARDEDVVGPGPGHDLREQAEGAGDRERACRRDQDRDVHVDLGERGQHPEDGHGHHEAGTRREHVEDDGIAHLDLADEPGRPAREMPLGPNRLFASHDPSPTLPGLIVQAAVVSPVASGRVKRAGGAVDPRRRRLATLVSLLNDQATDLTGRTALLERLERLYPAVVADCLDKVGVRTNVMDPRIRPLYPEARMAGFASTVHAVQVDAAAGEPRRLLQGRAAGGGRAAAPTTS